MSPLPHRTPGHCRQNPEANNCLSVIDCYIHIIENSLMARSTSIRNSQFYQGLCSELLSLCLKVLNSKFTISNKSIVQNDIIIPRINYLKRGTSFTSNLILNVQFHIMFYVFFSSRVKSIITIVIFFYKVPLLVKVGYADFF